MTEPITPPATGEETYEQYEARILAGGSQDEKSSDAPAAEPDAESASEPDKEDQEQDEPEKTDGEAAAPKKKGGYQRKIDKLSKEVETLKSQLAEKQPAAPATESAPKPEGPQFDQAKPKLEDFESIEEFTDALTDYKADKREWEREQKAVAEKAQAESKTLVEKWNSQLEQVKKAHADYDDVIEAAEEIQLSPAHQRLFLESPHGAEIAYDLAHDLEALETFAGLNPLAAAKYFGKLEAARTPAQTKSTPATRAPRPPATVGSRASASRPASPLDEHLASDYEAWERARIAQLRKRGN